MLAFQWPAPSIFSDRRRRIDSRRKPPEPKTRINQGISGQYSSAKKHASQGIAKGVLYPPLSCIPNLAIITPLCKPRKCSKSWHTPVFDDWEPKYSDHEHKLAHSPPDTHTHSHSNTPKSPSVNPPHLSVLERCVSEWRGIWPVIPCWWMRDITALGDRCHRRLKAPASRLERIEVEKGGGRKRKLLPQNG